MAVAAREITSSKSDTFERFEGNPVESGSLSDDKIDVLLAQERKLTILEAMNRKLTAERDELRQKCRIQAEKIQSLESNEIVKPAIRQKPTIAIDDLPMFDAAEFLPVKDLPEKETAMQRFKRLSGDLLIKK